MNAQFKAKLLQKLAAKKSNKGFTLIELLVVVIIVGVLAAVALPNLLGQVGKAREAEGSTGIGTINRAEQAHHFEKQVFLPITDAELRANNQLGVTVASDYFVYAVADNGANATTTTTATEGDGGVKDGIRLMSGQVAFAGGVYDAVVCRANTIGEAAPAATANPADPAASDCAGATKLD